MPLPATVAAQVASQRSAPAHLSSDVLSQPSMSRCSISRQRHARCATSNCPSASRPEASSCATAEFGGCTARAGTRENFDAWPMQPNLVAAAQLPQAGCVAAWPAGAGSGPAHSPTPVPCAIASVHHSTPAPAARLPAGGLQWSPEHPLAAPPPPASTPPACVPPQSAAPWQAAPWRRAAGTARSTTSLLRGQGSSVGKTMSPAGAAVARPIGVPLGFTRC